MDLGLPEGSITIGIYNYIPYIYRAIFTVLSETSNVYFIFVNIPSFYKSDRLIFVTDYTYMQYCDAVIDDSNNSPLNKTLITINNVENAIIYGSTELLINILKNLNFIKNTKKNLH